MDDKIKSVLNIECTVLLVRITKQKNTVLKITESMGVGYPHLVPFVVGMVYGELQEYFKNLYHSMGIVQEEKMRTDWVSYWKEKYPSLSDKIKTIYGL